VPPHLVDAFIERCQGSRLIVDLDDNLLDLSGRDDLASEYEAASVALGKLIAVADLVTVSTRALAGALADRAQQVKVVPNQLDDILWFGSTPEVEGLVQRASNELHLLYMGTFTHADDLAILRPTLDILRSRGLRPVLTVIGGEREGEDQEWYRRLVPPKDAATYPGFVRWLRPQAPQWDIAVAPLKDTSFNAFKSDIKFLDYTALGLPAVVSAAEAYRDTVDPGVHGLLAGWTPEDWAEQIERLCTDVPLREHITREARQYVRTKRTVARNTQVYVDVLEGRIPSGSDASVRT
jgi:O-antigen biosynthesis protein